MCAIYMYICYWLSSLSDSHNSAPSFFGMWKKRCHTENNYDTECCFFTYNFYHPEFFNDSNSDWNKYIIAFIYSTLYVLDKKVFGNFVFNADWTYVQIYNSCGDYGCLRYTNKYSFSKWFSQIGLTGSFRCGNIHRSSCTNKR